MIRTRLAHAAAATALAALLASCHAPEYLEDYTLATPELALESFKKAIRAEDTLLEFKAFSEKLKSERDLTWLKYQVGRKSFMSEHGDEVQLLLDSRITRVEYLPP